jgi:HlyD family secretion protein
MNLCLRSLPIVLIISIYMSAMSIAAPAADKPAKEEPAAAAAATDKPAKAEPAAATEAKPAKEEPAPAAAAKPAKEEPAAKPATPPAPTHTVKREPIKIQFELEGTFESRNMTEIILRPEEWSAYTVLEAVEHGSRVKKGDMLIKFDPEKIDKAIADLRAEQQIAELSIKLAEDQLAVMEKSLPMDLEASQRSQRIAEEDQKRYFESDRAMMLKIEDFNIKYITLQLDYSREELAQLEKMYKADDLTEETEKIVLKRARDDVERMEFILEYYTYNRDLTVKYEIPRRDDQVKDAAKRRNLAWAKDRVELPLALDRLRLELPRQKVQLARSKERLKNLLADQALMTITAPCDGYVYYGRCQRGKFSEIPSMVEVLRRGGMASTNRPILTIVEPRPIFIHSSVSEDRLQYMRNGMDGRASPIGYPDLKLDVTVDEVGKIPYSTGSYDLQVSLALEEQPPKVILPGMACKIKLTPYSKSDALVVPPKLVITDPLDDEKHFVYLQTKDGKSEKQDVTIGKQTDKATEILKGLSEGDKILLEAPKDGK